MRSRFILRGPTVHQRGIVVNVVLFGWARLSPFGRRKRADQQDGPRARGAYSRGRLRCATRRMWCAPTGGDVPMPRRRRSSGTAWHIKRTGESRGRSWTAQRTPAGSPGRRVPGGQGGTQAGVTASPHGTYRLQRATCMPLARGAPTCTTCGLRILFARFRDVHQRPKSA